ncbi:SMODS domain-containing nucleotidyltransferase [Burkholderia cepacia]|uniref:SMODS domain-containing nucleotidyltransferase n=1 Tax=Burkholderia cepacia TaxID=292 RepID=UPI0007543470|nr:nucleotidyltransferase [Burkholderia cepacia]KVL13098.1 nucleotidyltransferase [Burkholderia cepacia]KVQ26127.1 nucleotidyltransferase [Burkholderia cepacia]KVZ25759.1 nucleotidyltransferase [Burkholderia cepacia]
MSTADIFKEFLTNIAIDNDDQISLRYGEITGALNSEFRDIDSKTSNNLQVGSYGRWTAIRGISDLDMLYIVPNGLWDDYNNANGQSRLLTRTKNAIKTRYPRTEVFVDRLVVRVLYKDFHVEVQPVFEQSDGSFKYPDTYDGGSWKVTKPRDEIKAIREFDENKNKNLRRLCKMARAWKNKHGVGMGGLLIDTLAHNFLKSTEDYDTRSYLYYDWMCRDFFLYLSDLPDQDYFAALGSGQRVKVKDKFTKRAKIAYELSLKAIEESDLPKQCDKWKKVFGSPFPSRTTLQKSEAVAALEAAAVFGSARNTEQYIELQRPIDVRHAIKIDCDVSQNGFREARLTEMIRRRLPLRVQKRLRFYVSDHNIPGEFEVYWKVLNRGPEAIRKDCIRGQIVRDDGTLSINESTDFSGDHIVECYAVKNGIVIAKDRILVPITY